MIQLFKIAGAVAAAASIAVLGFNAGAASDGEGTTLLARMHGVGHKIHSGAHGSGAGHHLDHATRVLELDADQVEQFRAVHEAFAKQRDAYHDSLEALHVELLAQLEEGSTDRDRLRQALDSRLEAMRAAGYQAVDEVAGLADSLDRDQRERALRHLGQIVDRHMF